MKHEFRTSWSRNLVLFLVSAGLLATSCTIVWTGVTDDDVPVLLVPFAVIGTIFFGISSLGWCLRGLRFGPVIVLDSAGVFDRRIMSKPVPWSEIREIAGANAQRAAFVGLTVDRPERFAKKLSAFSQWVRALNKRNFLYDFQIGFAELDSDSGSFLEIVAEVAPPAAATAYEDFLEAGRVEAAAVRQRVVLPPRERLWARVLLVCSAAGALTCLVIAYFTALEVVFDPADGDWVIVTGTVDGFDNIARGGGDPESNTNRHAGIFIAGEMQRFVVKGDEPAYDAFVAEPWLGRTVTVRLYKKDMARAAWEIGLRSPRGAEISRQEKLEKFETRIWEMHANGREVVNLDANVQDAEKQWPGRLVVTLAFTGITVGLIFVARRNWRKLRGRPV